MRLTRSQGLPRAVLSAAVSLLAALMTQRRPPQGLTFRSPALPGLCSILFLTGWQGLLFLTWWTIR